jgi:cytochrome c553
MPDSTPRHVPGSPLAFSHAQTTDRFFAPDWHPEEHGPMPEVVSHGRKPGVFACAYCHLPNGAGRSENASLAGLPESYILEQISAMKSGRRRGSLPAMTGLMTVVARGVTDKDAKSAAHYFSALAPRAGWIRVFETDVVPTTHVIPVNVLAPVGDGKQEAIGNRIIEVPEDVDRTGLRDSAAGYVAYAPRGSVSRGKMLVTTGGGGTTIPCASCHGANLRGAAAIPSIAGRSPSYIFRQLSDIKAGTREGQEVALMKAPVAALSEDDMICIAAYLATLSN